MIDLKADPTYKTREEGLYRLIDVIANDTGLSYSWAEKMRKKVFNAQNLDHLNELSVMLTDKIGEVEQQNWEDYYKYDHDWS